LAVGILVRYFCGVFRGENLSVDLVGGNGGQATSTATAGPKLNDRAEVRERGRQHRASPAQRAGRPYGGKGKVNDGTENRAGLYTKVRTYKGKLQGRKSQTPAGSLRYGVLGDLHSFAEFHRGRRVDVFCAGGQTLSSNCNPRRIKFQAPEFLARLCMKRPG
jgi:hypothetical protein